MAPRPLTSALSVASLLVAACGGIATSDPRTDTATTGGTTTGVTMTGGTNAGDTTTGGTSTEDSGATSAGTAGKNGGSQTGGEVPVAGGGGDGDDCDEYSFWRALRERVTGGFADCDRHCEDWQTPGSVTFDSEGRIVDFVSTLSAVSEADWIESMASERWPCLADQTIEYCCHSLL